jgi:8-oxo-dGTP pyrophosphatase MutT (NUDIX family)
MPDRDWGVAVFVVRDKRVLLHRHKRLNRWLPPGGHIEPNELPDDAAIREVLEETGVQIELVSQPVIDCSGPDMPLSLTRPVGVLLVDIQSGHQHIDLIYFARARNDGDERAQWFSLSELSGLNLTAEIHAWCTAVLAEPPAYSP